MLIMDNGRRAFFSVIVCDEQDDRGLCLTRLFRQQLQCPAIRSLIITGHLKRVRPTEREHGHAAFIGYCITENSFCLGQTAFFVLANNREHSSQYDPSHKPNISRENPAMRDFD